jgi:hypothetical protein
MPEKNQTVKVKSETLRARANNCHRLATAIGHRGFTVKLSALAEEYEAMAVSAEAEPENH